ncbi:hypothetical protein DFH27DRAFT_630543 [Peziza echinospora]|nr:hypothetical protein DFH27DRAFT_630543 [Peziza echinospora]
MTGTREQAAGVVGDIILTCMPSAYHNAVFPRMARGIESGVCAAQGRPEGTDCGLDCVATHEITGLKPCREYPTLRGDMVREVDGAVFVDSEGGQRSVFPTVVFEVGFSQKLEELVHDVAVLLLGTGGATRVGVVVKLVELVAASGGGQSTRGGGAAKTTRRKRLREEDGVEEDLRWPTTPHSNPPGPGVSSTARPPPPAPPSATSTEAECSAAIDRLQEWYVQLDATPAQHHRPLVGPLEAWLYIFRRTSDIAIAHANQHHQTQHDQQQNSHPQGHPPPPPAPGISCTYTAKFLHRDQAIEGATYPLTLADLYGQDAASGGTTTTLTFPLAPIAAYILKTRTQMAHKRAWQRATRVYDSHASMLAKQGQKPAAITRANPPNVLGDSAGTLVLPNGMELRPRAHHARRPKEEGDRSGSGNTENIDPLVRQLLGDNGSKRAKTESWATIRAGKLAEMPE